MEKMKFDPERLELDKARNNVQKNKILMKILKNVKTIETLELEKENVRLTRLKEESRIMLQDAALMHEGKKKWLMNMTKEINMRRKGNV